jgi:hypothetical protein
MAPVPPPEEFTGPRPQAGPARDAAGLDAPARGEHGDGNAARGERWERGERRTRALGADAPGDVPGRRGEDTIQDLKRRGSRVPEPSVLASALAAVLAAIRGRNWLTGLVIPILAAVAVGVAVVIIVGANNGSAGPVPSSLSAGFPPARNAAADFTGTPALAGRGVDQRLSQVAVSGTTAVAVGSQSGAGVSRPLFFYSADSGRTWQLATVRATPAAGAAPALLAGGPHGWLALGPASAFISPNARSWTPETPLPRSPGDTVTVLTATASGFLAAGASEPGGDAAGASPVVWLSPNGTTWRRISGAALGLTSGAGRVLGITAAAASGNSVVITAAIQGGGSAAWLSRNGGTTWTPVTIPAQAHDSAAIAGLAPLGDGFVAVRADPANGSADIFSSADGTTWQRSATLTTANGAPLTLGPVSGGPAGAVVTGQADGFQIAFISANGTTWTGTDPVGSASSEQVSGAALTGGGQALIAGTSQGSSPGQQPMLSVIGTQGAPDQVDLRAIPGATIPEIGVSAIAASGATEVAAGSADGFPALWTSADGGVTWSRGTGTAPAVLDRPGDEQLTGVTHGAAGWVAVGGAAGGSGSGTGTAAGTGHPVVVTSVSGQDWTAADGEAAFAGSGEVTSAVAAGLKGRAGYVIVGRQDAGGHTIAAAWYATGLTGWQPAAGASPGALDGAGNRQMNAVTATAGGFAAVGSAGGHPAAWLSATGRTWSETTLPLPPGTVSAALRYAAANGETVAAAGTATTAAGTAVPFAAVSADGGRTWTQTLLPMPKAAAASAVTALTAAGGGFTATGTYGPPGDQDVVIWMLDRDAAPAATWTMAAPDDTGLAGPGSHAITALTSAGTTLTGAGYSATPDTEYPTLWQTPVRS